jgi:UDP-N-acetyl-D-mannosaminuronic acid dehydrogenase
MVIASASGQAALMGRRNGKNVQLIRKIRNKTAKIGVVGLGQVGLPTLLSFNDAGYNVVGLDTNEELIRNLMKGKTHIPEEKVGRLLRSGIRDRTLELSASPGVLGTIDVVIVCVPTPLSEQNSVKLDYLRNALMDIAKYLVSSRKLIIIESSIPPLTMDKLVIPTLGELSHMKTPSDFLISFCPERIAPGRAIAEMQRNVRVIGARDEESRAATAVLYGKLIKNKVIATDFVIAEISKLAENSFRDVNIAFANELSKICQLLGADVIDVIKTANTHPRVNIHMPGSGVGGPCLPKDPYLLLDKGGPNFSLIKAARSINDTMPSYLVQLLCDKLSSLRKEDKSIKIGILGVAYKADVNDSQYSPAKEIISELMKQGYQDIRVHDPYCRESFGAKFQPNLDTLLRESDCIIISTPHSDYSSIRLSSLKRNCVVFDPVRALELQDKSCERDILYIAPGIECKFR